MWTRWCGRLLKNLLRIIRIIANVVLFLLFFRVAFFDCVVNNKRMAKLRIYLCNLSSCATGTSYDATTAKIISRRDMAQPLYLNFHGVGCDIVQSKHRPKVKQCKVENRAKIENQREVNRINSCEIMINLCLEILFTLSSAMACRRREMNLNKSQIPCLRVIQCTTSNS